MMRNPRTTFVLTLRAERGDGVRDLRQVLKTLLRRHGFRCVDARETSCDGRPPRRVRCLYPVAGARHMALGKRKGIEVMPTFKYDARNGAFFKQDRVRTSNGWETEQSTVDRDELEMICDLEHIEVGWIAFEKGRAPELILVPVGQDYGKQPTKDHKEGFRLIVRLLPDDEPREFMSTAAAAWNAVDVLHSAYCNQRKDHVGELPVVGLHDIIETSTTNGKSFTPVFEIVDWVPRPPDMLPQPAGSNKSAKSPQSDADSFDKEIPWE
jgi:hypothetical protein